MNLRFMVTITVALLEALEQLNDEIVRCRKCPRLVLYLAKVACERRRAFRQWEYWGKPVPGFGDRLALSNAYISAVVRCAPPANKPLPSEIANCRTYLEQELAILRPRVIFALGRIAMRAYLSVLQTHGKIARLSAFPFRHGASYKLGGDMPCLFVSYHPSQQNTFTGKLTEAMLERVLGDIRKFLETK